MPTERKVPMVQRILARYRATRDLVTLLLGDCLDAVAKFPKLPVTSPFGVEEAGSYQH